MSPIVLMLPLSNNEARDLGIEPRGYTQIPRELQAKYGSWILAGNEFSHQLHCLVSQPTNFE